MAVPTARTPTVILVDDSLELRDLVRFGLERHGDFEVVGEGGDGLGGVELAAVHKPDVVLLDISMPLMDGLEALPLIRQASPGSAIIMFSAFGISRGAWASRLTGAAGFIEKGFSLQELPSRIGETLRAYKAG